MPAFPALTHVAVTVTDLGRSRPWYTSLFGADPVLDEDTGPFHHVVWLLGSTLYGIHQHSAPTSAEPCDELRPGLDHVAFGCANRAELQQWEAQLNSLGIANGGIVDAPYGSGLSFRDPDNIPLEFFAPSRLIATVDHMPLRQVRGLAADVRGVDDVRPPLVLLHGLSFDHTMWDPALAVLERLDPGRRVVALDLPGHGASASLASHSLPALSEVIRGAVDELGLATPVVVGHSMGGVIATFYAATNPAVGVVNVDQSLDVKSFVTLIQSISEQLRGPAFAQMWEGFRGTFHLELLPKAAQELVDATSTPRQDLVLSYWNDALEQPADDLDAQMVSMLAAIHASGQRYTFVAGSPLEPEYDDWLRGHLPQVEIEVFEESGHFPHLADPGRFAEILASTGRLRS